MKTEYKVITGDQNTFVKKMNELTKTNEKNASWVTGGDFTTVVVDGVLIHSQLMVLYGTS
jgi:hypothetical protein